MLFAHMKSSRLRRSFSCLYLFLEDFDRLAQCCQDPSGHLVFGRILAGRTHQFQLFILYRFVSDVVALYCTRECVFLEATGIQLAVVSDIRQVQLNYRVCMAVAVWLTALDYGNQMAGMLPSV